MALQGNSTAVTQIIKTKVRNLKPLPIAVQKLYALVGDINSHIQDVSRTISSDELLSTKILQIANSSFYGFPNRIASIPQAVSVIGFQSIRSLALSISVTQLDAGGGNKQHREEIWQESFLVANAARMMAARLRLKSPEDAFAAGIAHKIGQILLLQAFSAQYGQLLAQAKQNTNTLLELENKFFQVSHIDVGVMICQHWKLPKPLLLAVAEQNKPLNDPFPFTEEKSLTYILKRATRLVDCMDRGQGVDLDRQLSALAKPWTTQEALKEMMAVLPGEIKNIQVFLGQ